MNFTFYEFFIKCLIMISEKKLTEIVFCRKCLEFKPAVTEICVEFAFQELWLS